MTLVPEPRATRFWREVFKSSGRRRSSGVIDVIIASIRRSSFGSTLAPSGIISLIPGIFASRSLSEPIFCSVRSWVRKSSSVNCPRSMRSASFSAVSTSTTSSKSCIRPTTSPMPRIALRQALGAERLELVDGLAHGDEAHRHARRGADRERRAAARVAVELGEDQPVERNPRREAARHVHGLAAHHRVTDQCRVVGLRSFGDLLELEHQLVVDLQPAGGVEDDGVEVVRARVRDGLGADRRGVLALAREHLDADLLAQHAQLLARRGPAHVGGDQQRPLALLLQRARELRAAARLSGALQAEHHQARACGS